MGQPPRAKEGWDNVTALQPAAAFNTWGRSFCESHHTGYYCDGTTRVRCCRKTWGFEVWDHCALQRLRVARRWRLSFVVCSEQWMAAIKLLHSPRCGIFLLPASQGALLPGQRLLC